MFLILSGEGASNIGVSDQETAFKDRLAAALEIL